MVEFNPNKCINCLSCMTIQDCRILIDAIRHGGPRFGEEKCKNCTKCADICGKQALYNEEDIEMNVVKEFLTLKREINKEFGQLQEIDIKHNENGTGSISFIDSCKNEDEFFSKMRSVKEFIKSFGYSAELIKYPSDQYCSRAEARININFYGGEL